ncbi:hypothetical protein PGTUg99_036956 [Puccinia graminis f. sp. tritici]|uniref:Uncharacterized protein n=1 Tax=Puccinia graminis f. sp. tritici TaxID=56615 RepID=A0A5B0SHE7_PUCGR|nr:hypothetical protein PGTUg99_036956 [Puccinia graminis f. sp. tritici]
MVRLSLNSSRLTSLPSSPYDPSRNRIAVQGEFGGIGHIPGRHNLWNVQSQLDNLNQTYEITSTIDIWNYRATRFVEDLRDQAQFFNCSGGVYTQTTDVEGETNGLLTYNRRVLRPDLERWQKLISEIYAAPHQAAGKYVVSQAKPDKSQLLLPALVIK